jgi:Kef-type K+ transport system membrane component KefB
MKPQQVRNNLLLMNITIWCILGLAILLNNWRQHHTVLTPLAFLPVIMIMLACIRWYLQKKPHQYTRQGQWIMTLFALVIIFVAATLVTNN